MDVDVGKELLALAGGDVFVDVKSRSEAHQRQHGCGLHSAGGPQMQLVASLARLIAPMSILDLGCGLGYSTLWLASIVEPGSRVVGIDDDPDHISEATAIAVEFGYADRVEYRSGRVADVLETIEGPVDMIHDDAWFAARPAHLDAMVGLIRPGGLLTMVNWFLLVDAITGSPRNDWASFAGDDWAETTTEYANELASRSDLDVTWLENPPIAFAIRR
ncbi:O-methyltransferase [Ilumatobacter nonamiensis]|uniref:O-methyltransferase n=1 Tax=Ilumatobacter nonamiensis TaxID=467093 RepID=UPI000347129E|nr:methyltransferase [Ilumatobacter nonamiensis]